MQSRDVNVTHGTYILVPVPEFSPILPVLPNLCLQSSPGFGRQPEAIQRLLPWLDAKGAWRHQKRGAEVPLSSDLGLLIRYQDLTTSFQIHKIPTCDYRSRDININRQCGYGHKKHWCRVDANSRRGFRYAKKNHISTILETLLMNGKLLVVGIVLFFLLFFVYESWMIRGLPHWLDHHSLITCQCI